MNDQIADAARTVTMTYREALRAGLRDALSSDDRVFLMGEDVGAYGGCFAVSLGLWEEFGPERVRDTPLSESAFVGAGIGAALGGMRPVVEIMTVNFALLALDQIMNNAATLLHMSGGQFNVPLVIRLTTGAGRQLAAQHSHSLEAWFAHIPGLRIVAPATVADARAMLGAALADPDPVLIFEHGALFGESAELPERIEPVDLDRASIRRPGDDVTIVTHGASLYTSLDAAEQLAADGVAAEVIDLTDACVRSTPTRSWDPSDEPADWSSPRTGGAPEGSGRRSPRRWSSRPSGISMRRSNGSPRRRFRCPTPGTWNKQRWPTCTTSWLRCAGLCADG